MYLCFLTIIAVLSFGGMAAEAMGLDDSFIEVEYINAPEGTAFLDLLFTKTDDDEYLFDEKKAMGINNRICSSVYIRKKAIDGKIITREIKLDEHCGLAEYDDGFTSGMMRRCFINSNSSENNKTKLDLGKPSLAKNDEIFEYYGEFKVAYCNEDGDVLLVTDPVKVKIENQPCIYNVSADGKKATYSVQKDASVYLAPMIITVIAIIPVIVISGTIIVVTLLVIAVQKKKGKKVKVIHGLCIDAGLILLTILLAFIACRFFLF